MTQKRTVLRASRTFALVVLGTSILLGACAPGMTTEQVQQMVQQSVAQTVEAQNKMATSVAQTVQAAAPAATSTPLPTLPPLSLPTLTPLPTVTPIVIPSGGGGGGGGGAPVRAKYACDVYTVKPKDNTAFKPGDPFDIKWIITNTGTETWEAGKDFEWLSGVRMASNPGDELPKMDPNDTYTFTSDANAPMEKGDYVMTYKLEGGFCWAYIAITSGKPGDP